MSPARVLAVLLFSTLLACSGGSPGPAEDQGPSLPAIELGESTVGAPFSRSLAAARGTAPLSYSVQGLPSGISVDSQTGALSGSPAAAGRFDVDASVTDSAGRSDQRRYSLAVLEAPRFVTQSLPPATAAVTYVTRIEASGGKAPLVHALGSGALPPGLTLDASGTLSGAASTPGAFSFELAVTDAHGAVTRAPFTLQVRAPAPQIVTPPELPSGYATRAYRLTLSASGGTAPYAWTQPEGALPAGLSLSSTGELSGTPSASGTFSFTAELRDAQGLSARQAFSLVIIPALALATPALPDAYRGMAYSSVLEVSGGVAPYSSTLVTGALPAGVQLDTAGHFSGTPSAAGAASFTLTVQDASQQSITRAVSLTVYEPPGIATSTLRDGAVGTAYSETLQPMGGKAPYSFRLIVGSLPAGLQLSGNALTGTPTAPANASFTLEVRDANNQAGTRAFTLRVPSTLSITSTALPEGDTGQPYSAQLTATGGQGPLSWSFTGTLPPGLSLSSGGLISGTPSTAGSFPFTVRVADGTSSPDSRALTLVIQGPPVITTSGLADGYISTSYSATLLHTGGRAPFSWSVAGGSLPPGVSLSSAGVLSGAPAASSTFTFTARVTDTFGRANTRALSIVVYQPPSVSNPSLADGYATEAYAEGLSAVDGKPPYTFSVSSGSLPTGLTLASSGSLSGTPTSAGTATFDIQVRDANGRAGARSLSLTVYTLPTFVTAATLPEATRGQPYSQTLTASGGRPGYTFSLESGSPPTGITLSASGALSGQTPDTADATFTVRVLDFNGRGATRTFSLPVRVPSGSALFTVGQWNIEWFGSDTQGPPRSTSQGGSLDDLQLAHAQDILSGSGVNLWALVEMVDTSDFQALKAQLPGYDGFLADDARVTFGSSYYSPSEQKVGVLYDSRLTYQSATLILTSVQSDFAGRPPLRVDFLTSIHGVATPLTVIVLHMKAFDDQPSYDRRQSAALALKGYLDTNLSTRRVLVLGDWNDDVDVSITYGSTGSPLPSPYENFVADPSHYTFVTRPLSLAGENSTVDFPDMIDHTLASDEVMADYVSSSAFVLRPTWIPDYSGTTSDHYPVLSRYAFGAPP